jgi:hypothetical protein
MNAQVLILPVLPLWLIHPNPQALKLLRLLLMMVLLT